MGASSFECVHLCTYPYLTVCICVNIPICLCASVYISLFDCVRSLKKCGCVSMDREGIEHYLRRAVETKSALGVAG